MLNTVIDYSIFEDFVQNQPKAIPIGSIEENELWTSFWKFLKEGTNLSLILSETTSNIFITNLTTGRNGSNFNLLDKFNKPHKQIFPKNTHPQSVFFIDEKNENIKNKYREKNGFVFGFKNDYKTKWKELSLFGKPKELSVEKVESLQFKTWSDLNKYLLPFTDLIIADNYIFDNSLQSSNLFKIIKEFNKVATVKFNLLIVSYIGNKYELKINDIYNNLQKFLNTEKIECNLGIALTTGTIKRHDRAIYSNYLRINSGDSFNYFKSDGSFATRGTEISFYPLCENEKYTITENSLRKINEIINSLTKRIDADKYLMGNIKNKLLNFTK